MVKRPARLVDAAVSLLDWSADGTELIAQLIKICVGGINPRCEWPRICGFNTRGDFN